MYNGCDDPENDYSFILASNRDESYDRPSKNMAYWNEDPKVIGGSFLLIFALFVLYLLYFCCSTCFIFALYIK